MQESLTPASTEDSRRGIRGSHVLLIVLATVLVTAGATWWLVRTYIYPRDFEPVVLSQQEARQLDAKLQVLGVVAETRPSSTPAAKPEFDADGRLIPEKYSEAGASREVSLSERELNALVASNTDMARRLAIDLADNLVSAKLLVPVEPDFPVLGGKTLRVNAGVEMAFNGGRPVVVLKGVSIMGVPLPNAWLGGLKNIDLVGEFGADPGFWKTFADGVEHIRVADGELRIKLKE